MIENPVVKRPVMDDTFLRHAIKLKNVMRAGWISKVHIDKPESVADHTFSMCIAGMLLSDLDGLNTSRVMKMILLHDLAESITGDLMPGDIDIDTKRAREDQAMIEILAHLPRKVQIEYQKIWREFTQGKSKTAKFVHRIDKLEMALQADYYLKEGWPRKDLEVFFQAAENVVLTKNDTASSILRSLRSPD